MTTTLKHTPGPWTAANLAPGGSNRNANWQVLANGKSTVAIIPLNHATETSRESNARLLSKAWLLPEVEEVLKLVAANNSAAVPRARQLLAKLTEKGE